MLTIGDQAPAWTAKDQDGGLRSSNEFSGKPLLVYFYPKDDTPGCTAEACGFRDEYGKLSARIAIVGVSADDEESHRKFASKYSLPFPLLADPEKKIIGAFGVGTDFKKRVSFLIDASGRIVEIYTTIDCPSHASEILAALDARGM